MRATEERAMGPLNQFDPLAKALVAFFGFTANLVVSQVGPTAWRWQTASSVLPTIVLLSLIFVCPESPRFLMKHQRYAAAYKTLLGLRGEPVLAAKEMLYVHYQMVVEMAHLSHKRPDVEGAGVRATLQKGDSEKTPISTRFVRRFQRRSGRGINYWKKLGQLFTEKRVRRAMGTAVVCMIGQQLCGVGSVMDRDLTHNILIPIPGERAGFLQFDIFLRRR